ncbi:MAG: 30S ribosomal protein S17 [Bacteriovoracaceae bacterium]|jgi:small subunit ribosomal protein S17|nr:30S ribosomal protein S17 [Bacteriovoracaceae bacterium]
MSNQVFKKTLKGTVVSNKSAKTIVVNVERRLKHPIYSKFVTSSKKYHAHDEKGLAKEGDLVTIIESKPYSKMKRWALVAVN